MQPLPKKTASRPATENRYILHIRIANMTKVQKGEARITIGGIERTTLRAASARSSPTAVYSATKKIPRAGTPRGLDRLHQTVKSNCHAEAQQVQQCSPQTGTSRALERRSSNVIAEVQQHLPRTGTPRVVKTEDGCTEWLRAGRKLKRNSTYPEPAFQTTGKACIERYLRPKTPTANRH